MIQVSLWVMLLAGVLSFVRLVRGPTVADRLVAADTLSVIFPMLLVQLSLLLEAPHLLDVALAFAVLSFANMLLIAKYLERGALDR